MARKPLIGLKPYGKELLTLPTLLTMPDRHSYLHEKKNYLKINRDNERVWLSETNMVTHEVLLEGKGWIIVQRYNLKDLDERLQAYQKLFNQKALSYTALESCNACKVGLPGRKRYVVCSECFALLRGLILKRRRPKKTSKHLPSRPRKKAT